MIARTTATLTGLLADHETLGLTEMVDHIDIAPGSLAMTLDASIIADQPACDLETINVERLVAIHPFQFCKRGVETKIILADAPAGQDETLIRNIARAHASFDRIEAGAIFAEVAKGEGTSKRRIQQMIDLAFLAPGIVRDVLEGKQPVGFTSDWCKMHELPSDWSLQGAILATL